MSTTTTTRRSPSWAWGLTTAVVAAVVTTLVAAGLRAAGIPLEVDHEEIPILAFGELVLIFGVLGVVLARRVSRRTFLQVTLPLAVLSVVPGLVLGTGIDDKLGIVLTHAVATAIVVPSLARR